MTIVEFLRQRIAEDEAAALAAQERDGFGETRTFYSTPGPHRDDWGVWTFHIDPARVLAQVAAMRAIVEFHESWPVLAETPPKMSTATDDTGNMTVKMAKQVAWLTNEEYRKRFGDEPPTAPMLRHLAAIWRGHPDYDPAWAPEGG